MSDPSKAVFLSYASQDAEAARCICEALRGAGVEVWFDQSELRGGDAWDQKIRRQIRECTLFVPVISANTQARPEGYFRLEWRLADQRTHLMGKSKAFLLPVCIDATRDTNADVPDSFVAVQWTRLPGGETNAAFCEQVTTLLHGRREAISRNDASRAGGAVSPPRHRMPRTWLFPLAALVVVTATLAVWRPWKKGDAQSLPNSRSTAGAPLSEARKLAAKADALFEQDESALRESLVLAEQFCKQAVTLDPNDAEVWAVFSRVASHFIFLTHDRSQERRAQAGDAAHRAVRLAPGAFEAQFALANFYRLDDTTYPEAERMLRKLAGERPDDKRLWRTLAYTLRFPTIFAGKSRGRDEEAIEYFRRASLLPGGDPLALQGLASALAALGRLDEAEKAIEEAITLKPTGSAGMTKANLMLRYRGNIARARDAVAAMPVERLREDYGAFIATQTWLCAREPDKAIEVLRAVPRDYIEAIFDGPKGFLLGQAHQLAGRTQAATIEWRAALQVIERRLTAQPNQVRLFVWKAWLLACLGEKAEAGSLLQAAEQLGLSTRDSYWAAGIPLEWGDRAKSVDLLTQAAQDPVIVTRPFLRISPTWDRLRDDPRFELLLKEPAESNLKTGGGSASSIGVPSAKSVAVLAFKNLSAERENEYFSDGISEELLNVLAKVPGLRVTGRASMFQFKDTKTPIADIAKQLGVAFVVSGSVQRAGGDVKISAELIKMADGFTVWSDSFTRELKNVFALQEEIAGAIARNLQLKLGDAPSPVRQVHPGAHLLVLEGRYFWHLRTPDALAKAEAAFKRALALDPEFAQAYAGLADVQVIRASFALQEGIEEHSRPEDLRAARLDAQRAIALAPNLAEAYPALGQIAMMEGRFAEAEEPFQKAIALNPNYPIGYAWQAILRLSQGRLDAAIKMIEKTTELDPLWAVNLATHVEALFYCGRIDEALRVSDRASDLRSDLLMTNLGPRARVLHALGRRDEAVALARLIRRHPNNTPRRDADVSAIWILRQAGLESEVNAYVEEVFKRLPETSPQRGFIFGALERFEEALPFLQRTPHVPRRRLFWDPMWDRWRDDPRFRQLMVTLGCGPEYEVARSTLATMRRVK